MNSQEIKYTISIIENTKIKSINLNDFNKKTISFGRNKNNDIVLESPLISNKHGFFNIDDGSLSITDNNSLNGLSINNVNVTSKYNLKDGDVIKIDNPVLSLVEGVLMIVTIGEFNDRWLEYDMSGKNKIIIGRSKDCDIVLERVSIASKQAKLTKTNNGYSIDYIDNKNGIILNNSILLENTPLRNKDVFFINDITFIYDQGKLFYQLYDYGVNLDAIDVVKTVRLKFKKKNIVNHVNFSALPGQFIALVGGSGAGKSSFLKCISGVTKPSSGQILINGTDLYTNYSVLKNLIGYVPQENIIFDDLKLIDMLKYAANLRMPDDSTQEEKKKRIDEVLETVELLEKKNVMIRNLSGGQQKRACIAVELIADPKIFFLDEPTSGLDPGTERSLMKTLRKMANSGKTIILVTHNTLNLHLCDKVVFFGEGGKSCFDGTPKDALSFFGVEDFVDIYTLLNENTEEWNEKFNNSKYIEKKSEIKVEKNYIKNKKSKSFFRQFFTLLRRKFKTLFNNKQQLILIFGQAPLIAILLSFVVTNGLFYSYEETKAILFTLSTAAIWIGLLNSIQEICREKVILEKEFMADLRISAYILSKVIYLLILAFFQAILLVATFKLVTDVPSSGIVFDWFIDSTFIIFITILAASSMGLLVSAIAKNTEAALAMPTLLLVPQLLFSGMLFPLNGIVDKISNVILSRWSVEALGTINDLNTLVSSIQEVIPGYIRENEIYYTFTLEHLSYDVIIIILMTLIMIMGSYFILRLRLRKDR